MKLPLLPRELFRLLSDWNFHPIVRDSVHILEAAMRTLSVVSGACVLFTTLGYAHILHHHLSHSARADFNHPLFLAASLAAFAAGIFSFIGGFLLLKRLW